MAMIKTFAQALKGLRSGKGICVFPQESSRDPEKTVEPWQGKGNKRKKPQRS